MPSINPNSSWLAHVDTVIVTGASSGIGLCLGEAMAAFRPDILGINVSRSMPSGSLKSFHHVAVDLSKPTGPEEAAESLLTILLQSGRKGRILLINNAGRGTYGVFPAPDVATNASMIGLNVTAPVVLAGKLLPVLLERGGGIVNIASVAAYQPTPYLGAYGATKSFLLHWSLSLREELRGRGVRVLAVCPGPTPTNFFKAAGFDEPPASGIPGPDAAEVAAITLRALERDRAIVVPGWRNRLLTAVSGVLPKAFAARIGGAVLRKMRLERHQRGNSR